MNPNSRTQIDYFTIYANMVAAANKQATILANTLQHTENICDVTDGVISSASIMELRKEASNLSSMLASMQHAVEKMEKQSKR